MATGNTSESRVSGPAHAPSDSIAGVLGTAGAGSSRFQPLTFTGTATAYFRIHFVNLLLTLITLGVYVPWARVRHRRYFYSNTRILGDGLEYLARGRDLLLGWCIAVALVIIYNLIPLFDSEIPYLQLGYTGCLIFLAPWAMNKSLQFNARNIVWRDVRFRWEGTYAGVAFYLFLGPILGILSLGILLPMFSRLMRHYIATHYSFGGKRFGINTSLADFYRALLAAIGVFLGLACIIGGPALLYFSLGERWDSQLMKLFQLGQEFGIVIVLMLQLFAVAAFSIAAFHYRATTRNLMVNGLGLADDIRFQSTISPYRLIVITLQNVFLSIISLSLLWPWAQVRRYRYMTQQTHIAADGDVEAFVDALQANSTAVGDGLAEAGGIEISI